ncbi:hypothetical protein RI367_000156 [Sorochytrium milnesiophthora]
MLLQPAQSTRAVWLLLLALAAAALATTLPSSKATLVEVTATIAADPPRPSPGTSRTRPFKDLQLQCDVDTLHAKRKADQPVATEPKIQQPPSPPPRSRQQDDVTDVAVSAANDLSLRLLMQAAAQLKLPQYQSNPFLEQLDPAALATQQALIDDVQDSFWDSHLRVPDVSDMSAHIGSIFGFQLQRQQQQLRQQERQQQVERQQQMSMFQSFQHWRASLLKREGRADDAPQKQRKVVRPAPSQDGGATLGDIDFEDNEPSQLIADIPTPDAVLPPPPPVSDLPTVKPDSSPAANATGVITSDPDAREPKDRTNYASFDCAAIIRASNPEAKGTSAILTESKEHYMINQCRAAKYVVVELCDEILIDTIVLANYELFASTFKDFRVFISDRYASTDASIWKLLGDFQARNARSAQVFTVKEPVAWARYIRIDFLSHYGRQHYCPVSLLRVHGATMLEEYKREEERQTSGGSDSVNTSVSDVSTTGTLATPLSQTPLLEPGAQPASDPAGNPSTQTASSRHGQTHAGITAPSRSSSVASETKTLPYTAPEPSPATAITSQPKMPNDLQTPPYLNVSSTCTPTKFPGNPTSPTISPTSAGVSEPPTTPTSSMSISRSPPANDTSFLSTAKQSTTSTTPLPSALSSTPQPGPTFPSPAPSPSPSSSSSSSSSSTESIYRTIMKRFGVMEDNYNLFVRYMEEFAGEVNKMITAVGASNRQQNALLLTQLGQQILLRTAELRAELRLVIEQELDKQYQTQERLENHIHELRSQVQTLMTDNTQLRRWLNVQFAVIIIAMLGPIIKFGVVTILKFSIGQRSIADRERKSSKSLRNGQLNGSRYRSRTVKRRVSLTMSRSQLLPDGTPSPPRRTNSFPPLGGGGNAAQALMKARAKVSSPLASARSADFSDLPRPSSPLGKSMPDLVLHASVSLDDDHAQGAL